MQENVFANIYANPIEDTTATSQFEYFSDLGSCIPKLCRMETDVEAKKKHF